MSTKIQSTSRDTLKTDVQKSPPLRVTEGASQNLTSQQGSPDLSMSHKKDIAFVELMARSHFSFLQAASAPEDLVEQAIRLGYSGIGLCDLNGLYGIARGYQAATSPSLFTASAQPQKNFHYLFGCELALTDLTQLILIPMSKRGYTQLCQLITQGKRGAQKNFIRLHWHDLMCSNDDLICFYIPPFMTETYEKLEKIFHDRLYIPVWRDFTWESSEQGHQAFALEQSHQARLFVTQRPLMHHPDQKMLFDVMTCIHHHCTLEEAQTRLPLNAERTLHSLAHLAHLWQDRPDLLSVTIEIARRVQFQLSEIRYRYPESQLPQGLSKRSYLRRLCLDGLKKKFPEGASASVQERVDYELELIGDLEYEDYFLTLFEICQFAQEQGILYQGRGSAANSVVCFCLGLTNVNPTEIDLLFERFISRERGEPPDIDIDFEHERREEVIQHIYQKYQAEHAAMVCTVIRYRSRMAIREVCKVFGVPLATINRIINFMGRDGLHRLKTTQDLESQLGITSETWSWILQLAQQLHGTPRHLGIHTGGFLITHDPITEIIPVEKASMDGRYVIQWNKDDVSFLRLMKIDILSLGMLTALRKCLNLLAQHKNIHWNLAQIPREDTATYDMICEADTVGVFQIESRAQMSTLPRMQPRNYYDLVIEIALIRPGPLQGGMVHPFLKRRQGLEKISYIHPDLEFVLKKTLGVPLFQEQVMKIAVIAAGFSPGEADELRRIVSSAWKKKLTMDGLRLRLLSGMKSRGIPEVDAQKVLQTIEGFAHYGFPESHSASFALLTYASCYLKRHHPDAYVCALLNSQPMGFYPPRSLIEDVKRHRPHQEGIVIHPLCVQKSAWDYTLERDSSKADVSQIRHNIRMGFRCIHGFRKTWADSIEHARDESSFQNLSDFIQRTHLPKQALAMLAASNAFQTLLQQQTANPREQEPAMTPRDLIWHIEGLNLQNDSMGYGDLCSGHALPDTQIPNENSWQALQRQYQQMGFSPEYHPMGLLREDLMHFNQIFKAHRFVTYSHSQEIREQAQRFIKNPRGSQQPKKPAIRTAGILSMHQRPPTAKGFCFLTVEDEYGFTNIIVPPDIYQRDRMVIYESLFIEVQGFLEVSQRVINIKAQRLLPLRPYRKQNQPTIAP